MLWSLPVHPFSHSHVLLSLVLFQKEFSLLQSICNDLLGSEKLQEPIFSNQSDLSVSVIGMQYFVLNFAFPKFKVSPWVGVWWWVVNNALLELIWLGLVDMQTSPVFFSPVTMLHSYFVTSVTLARFLSYSICLIASTWAFLSLCFL